MGGCRAEGNPGQQLTGSWGSQSHNHKELDYVNWDEFGSGFLPGASRLDPKPLIPWFLPCKILIRESSQTTEFLIYIVMG